MGTARRRRSWPHVAAVGRTWRGHLLENNPQNRARPQDDVSKASPNSLKLYIIYYILYIIYYILYRIYYIVYIIYYILYIIYYILYIIFYIYIYILSIIYYVYYIYIYIYIIHILFYHLFCIYRVSIIYARGELHRPKQRF